MNGRTLESLVELLRDSYGDPELPEVTEPLDLILWENVAYLASDEKRAEAFALLRQRVGTDPAAILAAPQSILLEIARAGGIFPERRVSKLMDIAMLVLSTGEGGLAPALDEAPAVAKNVLRRFPGIGDPGAEKILLFSRRQAVLALDSNGVRVLLRLGFGEEGRSYSATYRSVQRAAQATAPRDFAGLIRAHQLLRHHGQELCRRSSPACEACPLQLSCLYYRDARSR
jgi:endonuclease-3